MAPKGLVIRAAGSNCDLETKFAFEFVGARVDLVHINRLVNHEVRLRDYQILAIPGGFTYGDDISAGKILANELRHKLADELYDFHQQGKLIIGICNGFQVLVKAGLLPVVGFTVDQLVTLTNNDSGKFEDRWTYLRINESPCVFTKNTKVQVTFPVAHAEGKLVPRDAAALETLRKNRQIVFQYVAPDGSKARYPHNPSGTVEDIAGICDPTGRVLGLMPHPERHFDPTNHPRWTREGLKTEGDGIAIFRNAVKYFQ